MMFYQLPLHLPPFLYKPRGHLMNLFWSGATRRIAQTFIIVFSSVYIYESFVKLGFDYSASILLVCLFFVLFIIAKLISLSLAEDISRHMGFKGVIWLSAIPYVFFIPTMIYAGNNPYFFYISSILYGAHSAFYWWGYHGYFIKEGDKRHYGGGIGTMELINTLSVVAAPFIGGVVVSIFGFSSLYALSGLFMLLSLLLLGRGHDRRQRKDVVFWDVVKLVAKHKAMSLGYISTGIEGMFYFIAWPLFLFFLFGEVISLGTFVALSMLIAAILSVFVGNKIDKEGERGVVAISSPAISFSWLLKVVSVRLPVLIIAESIRNFGEKILSISLIELTYKKANEAETAKAILFRELTILIGGLVCIIIIALSAIFNFDIRVLFIFISIFALSPLISVFKKRI